MGEPGTCLCACGSRSILPVGADHEKRHNITSDLTSKAPALILGFAVGRRSYHMDTGCCRKGMETLRAG
ncbi:hypothetical protein KIM372_07660 [Bombiscardovia nodaiensis]|uniref:Uncharacterized protein n=1 Tax=Bombiscardovia nodaiensis TaxID=2932181 RepID=A0ABN6S9R8_9BIFI|nr:hypothetical protein KIM372_07660 [Bombiscardovia nodaiensis]